MRKETWSLTDHICQVCAGRILQAEHRVITGGGNPLFRCADCGRGGSAIMPDVLCWCGWSFKGSTEHPYRCALKRKHPEWERAFQACGTWDAPGEVGIVNEDYLRRMLAAEQDGNDNAA